MDADIGGPVQRGLARRVPILMYHQITPAPHPAFRKYAITPAVFARQMRWIARNGFVPVRLGDAFGIDARDLPEKPLVITFDDGFSDCNEHAVPILASRGFTATFFVVAGLAGKRSEWLVRERGLEYPLMDWPAVRQLVDDGFECGAHSMSHPRLAELSAGACHRELQDSRREIEDHIGRAVRHVAYPFGSFSASVRDIAAACGYRSGCTVRAGVASTADDPLALARVPVNGTDGPLEFTRSLDRTQPIWKAAARAARQACQSFLARS